ncbi:MAG TPA: polyketide synthase, partial [Mycobacterium sp.]|nr:polyketide synthase [Mycobacterium sp.]
MSIPTLPDGRIPVLLSAHAEDLLAADAAAIAGYLGAHRGAATVAQVAAALLSTRRIRRHRAVIRARDHRELTEALAAAAAGTEHPRVARSARTAAPRIAFVF